MPEIGAMLREARMRAGLDVSELEAQTKIRARYLRALENEEWDVLPGSSYVKSFLRTYAEKLGLDAKLLVEEYKLRHERLSEMEMQPIIPSSGRDRRRPSPRGGAIARRGAVAVVALGLVVLIVLGLTRPGHRGAPVRTSTPAVANPAPAPPARHRRRTIVLQLRPTAPVYVCLDAAGGRRIINGQILTPTSPSPAYRARSFRITLGNGSVRLRVDGRLIPVPATAAGIGYELTPAGHRVLASAQRPTCA